MLTQTIDLINNTINVPPNESTDDTEIKSDRLNHPILFVNDPFALSFFFNGFF